MGGSESSACDKPRCGAGTLVKLIAGTVYAQRVPAGQVSFRADRGTSMTSKTVSQLLDDLGVLQSHSRRHQSNDNPFSESHFKTLKYFPTFPSRFAGLVSVRSFVDGFFDQSRQQPPPPLGHRPAHPRRRALRPSR